MLENWRLDIGGTATKTFEMLPYIKTKMPSLPMVILVLAVLFVVLIRVRLLQVPLERDEGEFAYGGQLMLQGIPPYKLFYNMKFPGIYAAYALIMGIFGQTALGIHLGLLVINLVCIILLYQLGLRLLNPAGAAVAAAAYAVLSTSPVLLGLSAHATHFVVVSYLAGLLLLLRAEASGKNWLFFLSGVLMGVSCLMKQPGAMFGLFGLCLLVWNAILHRNQWREHLRRILLYSLGGVVILMATAFILWRVGVWQRFWFWTFVYAKVHATEYSFSFGWGSLVGFLRTLPLLGDGLLWIGAGLGLFCLCFLKPVAERSIWIGGLLVFSFIAVSGDWFYSQHYFVMLLPALCLLIGVAYDNFARWGALWANVGIAIALAIIFVCHRFVFFLLSPPEACRAMFSINPFVEAPQIAQMLAEHSRPDATIAILGSEPEIPFYAHRHSATGYIYAYDFFQPQPYSAEMQKEMMAEIEKAQPEYLLWVKIPASWDNWPTFEHTSHTPIMAWIPKFQKEFYEPFGLVNVNPTDSEYFWGKDAFSHASGGDLIAIFKHR